MPTATHRHSSQIARRKRNQYTLIACVSCKSRKIKCDGVWPCECCKKRGATCCYPRRGNLPLMGLTAEPSCPGETEDPRPPRDAVAPRSAADSNGVPTSDPTQLSASSVQANGNPNASPPGSGSHKADAVPVSRRRSSFDHTFDLAKSCLESNGLVGSEEQEPNGSNMPARFAVEHSPTFELGYYAESILALGYERAQQILSIFTGTIHVIYPCVDLFAIRALLDALFGYPTEDRTQDACQLPPVSLTKIDILKAVLGLTLLVEGDDTNSLVLHLQRHIDWSIEKFVLGRGPDTDDIVIATLMSMYFFQKCQHLKAWRLIGLASKACYELGIYQVIEETRKGAETQHSAFLQELVCSVYILDRTSSFVTSLPSTMKDGDIEDKILQPGASAPSLTVTVEYTRLISEIFTFLKTSPRNYIETHQRQEYLDYKVQHLRNKFRDLIATARLTASSGKDHNHLQNEAVLENLENFLAIRINHARMMIRKPFLHSYAGDGERRRAVDISIKCAQESISLCLKAISQSNPLNYFRSSYEYFMISSLATILLVVSQDPETYGPECREAFHNAIRSLRVLKSRHFDPQKLCFTFDQLVKIGECINMPQDDSDSIQTRQNWDNLDPGNLLNDLRSPSAYNIGTFDDNLFNLFDANGDWQWNYNYF